MSEDFERGRKVAHGICKGFAIQHGLYGDVEVLHTSATRMVALVRPTHHDGRKQETWPDDSWVMVVRVSGGDDEPTQYTAMVEPAHKVADGLAKALLHVAQETGAALARVVELAARGALAPRVNAPYWLDRARVFARDEGLRGDVEVLHTQPQSAVTLVWPHADDTRTDGPWLLTLTEHGPEDRADYISHHLAPVRATAEAPTRG